MQENGKKNAEPNFLNDNTTLVQQASDLPLIKVKSLINLEKQKTGA